MVALGTACLLFLRSFWGSVHKKSAAIRRGNMDSLTDQSDSKPKFFLDGHSVGLMIFWWMIRFAGEFASAWQKIMFLLQNLKWICGEILDGLFAFDVYR